NRGAMVSDRVRHGDRNDGPSVGKVREVPDPFPDFRNGSSASVHHREREASSYSRMDIPKGSGEPQRKVGQSVLYGRRARSGFLEAVKYRIWAYPVALGQ